MKASENRLVIQAKTQIGATEMAPPHINKITNIPNESSCSAEHVRRLKTKSLK